MYSISRRRMEKQRGRTPKGWKNQLFWFEDRNKSRGQSLAAYDSLDDDDDDDDKEEEEKEEKEEKKKEEYF
jgi:hypothetical protein